MVKGEKKKHKGNTTPIKNRKWHKGGKGEPEPGKLGTGVRWKSLHKKLEKNKKIRNVDAVEAAIMRKKYHRNIRHKS